MGLFGNDKEKNSKVKDVEQEEEFKSIVVESDNIPRELKSISVSKKISLNELDFNILKTKTQVMITRDEGWIEADKEVLDKFKDKDFLLNKDLKIRQLYKVEIFNTNLHDKKVLPSIVLGANKLLTKVVCTIKKDLDLKYYSKLEHDIIEEINKKKIKAGVMVGFNDEDMYKEVKKLVSSVRVNGFLNEDIQFIACKGIDPVEPVNDEFIYHYKQNVSAEDTNGRVDYSKRGYVLAVSKDDCIMEYIKPKLGTPGRNCQGKFLAVEEPNDDNEIQINFTENIIKKEDDEKIKYIANKNGYVVEENGTYDIRDEMVVDEVSFKSTGSIETDLDSEVIINIKESDVFKDAVGPGMSVETYELNVEGNVGSGAKIKTEKITIGGQTHKTSHIESKEAKIAMHRGVVIGGQIEVERLEGGKIVGDDVHVKQAIGGEIIAKTVNIDELTSNAVIISSDLIEIQNLKGTNNKLIIDPSSTKEFNKEIEEIKSKIENLSFKIKQIPKVLEEKKRTLDRIKPTISMVQEKIKELKSSGKKPPLTLLKKLKDFQKMVTDYNLSLNDYKNKKLKIQNLKEDLAQVQNRIFSAKIINHSPWKEFNEIKFKLISPPIEKVYNTKEHEIIREITLKETADEGFEIKRSSEYSN
ncbi:flagellar assembly protein A [Sulfurospirillum sp. 1307]